MRLVLDASAALYIASSRRGFAGLRGHDLVAPPLFWSETLSGLHQSVYRHAVSADLAARARAAIRRVPIERSQPAELYERAWRVADDLGWAKTYDAEYIALADLLGIGLLTRDEGMHAGGSRFVTVLAPGDL